MTPTDLLRERTQHRLLEKQLRDLEKEIEQMSDETPTPEAVEFLKTTILKLIELCSQLGDLTMKSREHVHQLLQAVEDHYSGD